MRANLIPAPARANGMHGPAAPGQSSRASRGRYWGGLAIVLATSLGLRLWGVKQGLPYVYNVDEYGHFVPEAVAMFHSGLNPHYFVNPPALTYLLHAVDAVLLGGGAAATE